MEVQIKDKTYQVREIKYKQILKIGSADKEEAGKKLMQLACDISDEDYDNLSMKDGMKLQNAINDLNGLGEDFQDALKK